MEEHFAVRQRADVLAVLLFVGDVHERGMDLAALVVLQRVRELAEAPGEGHLLQVIERLAAKEQDRMLVPRALDVPKERTVHRLRELHIEHLRADRRRELS